MKLQLVRHATLWLEISGVKLLIDPMFSDAGASPPITGSDNTRRNPLVPTPFPAEALTAPDAVIVTHLHRDHWDAAAAAALPKSVPVFCQPGDEQTLGADGFTGGRSIEPSVAFQGVTITRTSGRHGKGSIGRQMGQVSGFVLQAGGEPAVYVAGDTIWCDDVAEALDTHRPHVTVVNAGGARFTSGDPITMDADDVIALCRHAPYMKVVAVHMDAINHCLVTREDLRRRLEAERLLSQAAVPEDGEWV